MIGIIELQYYSKVIKEKKGVEIIKDYSHKAKIWGYVDGMRFFTDKKKLLGLIQKNDNENHIAKYEGGLDYLKLNQKGEIFSLDGKEELLGYIKDNKIYYPDGQIYIEYFNEKGEIQRLKRKTRGKLARFDIIRLKKKPSNLNMITFFGIASFYLEIFA
ncbi:MAG: hypothetical protein GY870_03980 [archaeon]|nr:hypothetical protein [archaeon]